MLSDNTIRPAVFLSTLALIIFAIVAFRFDRYYLARDYVIQVYTPCDPAVHSCFISDVSIADPAYQSGPYEKVNISAHEAPLCLEEHTCADFDCKTAGSCSIMYCSSDVLGDGESCAQK